MGAMRNTWTDDRLDDLARRMDSGFDRVDKDIRELRSEINARFDASEVRNDTRFDALGTRFESLQRTVVQVGGGMFATFAVGFVGLIVTRL